MTIVKVLYRYSLNKGVMFLLIRINLSKSVLFCNLLVCLECLIGIIDLLIHGIHHTSGKGFHHLSNLCLVLPDLLLVPLVLVLEPVDLLFGHARLLEQLGEVHG